MEEEKWIQMAGLVYLEIVTVVLHGTPLMAVRWLFVPFEVIYGVVCGVRSRRSKREEAVTTGTSE